MGALIAFVAVVVFAATRPMPEDDTVRLDGYNRDEGWTEVGTRVKVGDMAAFTGNRIENTGTEPVTIRSAEMTASELPDSDPSKPVAAKVVGVWLHPTRSQVQVDAGQWPENYNYPKSTLLPVAGYVLKPGLRFEVVFLVKAEQAGERAWTETTVRFEKGGQTYVTKSRLRFRVCAPIDAICAGKPPA